MEFKPELLPTIRKLEIHAKRHVLSQTLTGNWLSRIKGHGIEFTGFRAYQPGDDANLIDWRASVRSRKLLVKELSEEKNLNIFIMLDVSDTMLFGTTDKLKAEYAAEVVSSLSFAALRSGENVALTLFSDRVKRFVNLKQGAMSHGILMKALSNAEYYGGKKNFTKVATQQMSLMGSPGLIIVVSDFIGVDEAFEHNLKVLSKKYDLLCVMIRDPRDRTLPQHGEYILSDPTTGQKIVIDAADYYAPYKKYVEEEEKHLMELLTLARGDMVILETTDDYASKLIRFFLIHNQRVKE